VYSHIKLVDWTPGKLYTSVTSPSNDPAVTKVYNVNIYNSLGIPLCSIHRLKLQEVSTLPPATVEKRYELIYQPVAIDFTVSPLDEPLDTYDDDERDLHHYLDILAQEVMAESLAKNPEVGPEASLKPVLILGSRLTFPYDSRTVKDISPSLKKLLRVILGLPPQSKGSPI
jgi:hypothetical protein